MKHLKNNAVNGNYLLTERSLFISFLVAALFFTSCNKDQLQYSKQMVASEKKHSTHTILHIHTH